MKNKIFLIIFFCFLFSFNCFCLSDFTYGALAQNNSNCQNLISLAMNYSDFSKSDFVCYQNGQYSYRIVWGDLVRSGNSITSSGSVTYITYSRSSDDYTYSYVVSNSNNFDLNVSTVFVGNLSGFGMKSSLYEQYHFYNVVSEFLIFGLAFLFIILLLKFKRSY